MNLRTQRARLRLAEAECMRVRAASVEAWDGFKDEAVVAATPGRIVVVGVVAGFLAGLPGGRRDGVGSLLGGKLLRLLADSAFANLGEALAAGAALADAENADDDVAPKAAPSARSSAGSARA